MENNIVFMYNGTIHTTLTKETVDALKSTHVKNHYQDDYMLFDFFKDILFSFGWKFEKNTAYSVIDIINRLKCEILEVEYLYDDLLSCIK